MGILRGVALMAVLLPNSTASTARPRRRMWWVGLLAMGLAMAAGAEALAQTQQMFTVDSSVGTPYAVTSDAAGNIYFPLNGYIAELGAGSTTQIALPVALAAGIYPFQYPVVAVNSDITGDLFVAVQYPLNSPNNGPYTDVYELTRVPVNFTGNTTSGSTLISGLSSVTGLVAQQLIAGPGIPPGAKILTVGSGTITLNYAATATATGVALQTANYTWGGQVAGPSMPPPLANGNGDSTLNSMAYDNLNGFLYTDYLTGGDGIQYVSCTKIPILFTANTTNGSATITNVSSISV